MKNLLTFFTLSLVISTTSMIGVVKAQKNNPISTKISTPSFHSQTMALKYLSYEMPDIEMDILRERPNTIEILPDFKAEYEKQSHPEIDAVLQKVYSEEAKNSKGIIQNFSGIGNQFGIAPPDTDGDVGISHYVQMVNNGFRVFDKTGNALSPVLPLSLIWSSLGTQLNNINDGDPIVLYDEMADRWVFMQFKSTSPYYLLIAVSVNSDPLGGYYAYGYSFTDFQDYPKLGVWPDGYYVSTNKFNGSGLFTGTMCGVFERDQMLIGNPGARLLQNNFGGSLADPYCFLPSDLDGVEPPANTPNTFAYIDYWNTPQRLKLFQFTTNWSIPSLTSTSSYINVAGITLLSSDLPQPYSGQSLDPLDDRLMFRLQYRNFGTYQTLVTNHTVDAGSNRAGIRWYELRNGGSGWGLYQSGTYAPNDGYHRWMGSIAMNRNGDIALGYSITGSTLNPSIRYTGRLSGNTLGTMTVSETTIQTGGGSQTGTNRWGDYSCMSIDPVDDYTFWYTQEYMQNTSSSPWRTRIASFQFGTAPSADVWNGAVSDDWFLGANWNDGSVPTKRDKVTIVGNPGNFSPNVSTNLTIGTDVGDITLSNNAIFSVVGNLTINEGRKLASTSVGGNSDLLMVSGDFVSEGSFLAANSEVFLDGNQTAIVDLKERKTSSWTTLYNSTTTAYSAYFDISSTGVGDIGINSFDVNLLNPAPVTVEIWWNPSGSYVGNQSNPSVWMQVCPPINVNVIGSDFPVHIDINQFGPANIYIGSGQVCGFFISAYGSGSASGDLRLTQISSSTSYSKDGISINCGESCSNIQPGMGGNTNNYAWNGTVYYDIGNSQQGFNNLTVAKYHASVISNSPINVGNDFTLSSAAQLTLSPENGLFVTGNATFEADANGIYSFLDDMGGFWVGGNTDFQQYITPDRWHIISPPTTTTSQAYLGHHLYWWRESDSSFQTITSTTYNLAIDTGYFSYKFTTADTVHFSGMPNNNSIYMNLPYTTGQGGEGWNLLGNPFPSYLDFDGSSAWGMNNVDNTIYFYDDVNAQYLYWNPFTGLGSAPSGFIPPSNGFWVKANASGATITLPASKRAHSTENFYKTSPYSNVTLQIKNDKYTVNTMLVLHPESSYGFDSKYDSYFLRGMNDNPHFSIFMDNKDLAMNAIPNTELVIPIHFSTVQNGIYQFSIEDISSAGEFDEIYLEDLKTNTFINLNKNTYTFFAHEKDEIHRFNIYFSNPLSINEDMSTKVNIFSHKNTITVQTEEAKGQINVIDILGQSVYSTTVTNNTQRFDIDKEGVYIVEVRNGSSIATEKVYIK